MKKNKGVTLISLVITIIVLIILTFTISINVESYNNEKIKSNFRSDIKILKDEINQYYARIKELPVANEYGNISMIEDIKNVNDGDKYYIIDIKQLDVVLNNGHDYEEVYKRNNTDKITDLTDLYIINEQSHTIYYPKGVNYDGKIHYTLENSYTQINY